ncbi:uncharacterized protein BDZ99DRAFT_464439 [Mytilinidion resinicola]|uniref:Uncharacterized protein n=1 Tax=Mytilinidion resinicola TaxID=574789 RepID=A0A6A6YIG0_9PEZI|nr:uncharacterized protein BDZ99DRAFT_464439 [Mytilinidion resinicola]KAF2808580.1 hypothetical protein BDZ99DRAFT_464439 [Mytilinidion resinicola]
MSCPYHQKDQDYTPVVPPPSISPNTFSAQTFTISAPSSGKVNATSSNITTRTPISAPSTP